MPKLRLDSAMVQARAAKDLEEARRLIRAGRVTVCKHGKPFAMNVGNRMVTAPPATACTGAVNYHQNPGSYFIVGDRAYRNFGTSRWMESDSLYGARALRGVESKLESHLIRVAIQHAIHRKFKAARDDVRAGIQRMLKTQGERYGRLMTMSRSIPGEGWDDKLGQISAKTEKGRVKQLMRIVEAWNNAFPKEKIKI